VSTFRFNDAEFRRMRQDHTSGVAVYFRHAGAVVATSQRRRAAVSPDGSHGRPPGYMRARIRWEEGWDARGQYIDVGTDARTPDGKPYPLFVEFGTPPHVIESTGPWPLRNPQTGQVFGRIVHHPGTSPQPFLRPSLFDMPRP
jgi:hypothetical protein